jgi:hypothetical protein
MTRLAKANKVFKAVGSFDAIEVAKRHDVVDWNSGANVLFAPLTCLTVSFNSKHSGLEPSFAAICRDSTHIIGRHFSALVFSLKGAVTGLAAKLAPRFCFVLSIKPRLYVKFLRTLSAYVLNSLDRVECVPLGKSVSWPFAASPFVPQLMVARHLSALHMPFASARLTTKPCGFGTVRLHDKLGGADFASLLNHKTFIARTTGVAKPVQAGFDL